MTKEDRELQMTDNDRKRAFKRMARNMAKMIDWPSDEKLIRACGDAICDGCGLRYSDHPEENGLVLSCDGRLLKL